jgi:hypothetical protein
MPTLTEIIKPSSGIRAKPLPEAHWVEYHWILPRGSWEGGVAALAKAMPRDARPQRPAPWYRLLARTHWPGRVPPGNGPFYVPDWAVDGPAMEDALKGSGFQRVVAHVVVLPPDAEYLTSAMRAAGSHAWNADPLLYRGYIYPSLKALARQPLRDYNAERWVI